MVGSYWRRQLLLAHGYPARKKAAHARRAPGYAMLRGFMGTHSLNKVLQTQLNGQGRLSHAAVS